MLKKSLILLFTLGLFFSSALSTCFAGADFSKPRGNSGNQGGSGEKAGQALGN